MGVGSEKSGNIRVKKRRQLAAVASSARKESLGYPSIGTVESAIISLPIEMYQAQLILFFWCDPSLEMEILSEFRSFSIISFVIGVVVIVPSNRFVATDSELIKYAHFLTFGNPIVLVQN